MLTPEQKRKKQRLIRYIIGGCILLIPLLGYLQRGLLKGDFNLPFSSTVLIFALININGLLLLLMLYLVLRNLVELVFERNQKILGSKLRTRLVVSFVALSLVPTILLFFIALRFVSTSMDYWFNSNVEDSLQASLKLAQSIFHDTEQRAESIGDQLAELLENGTVRIKDLGELEQLFRRTLAIAPPGAPDSISLMDHNHHQLLSLRGPRLLSTALPAIPSEAMRQAANSKATKIITLNTSDGELILAIVPVQLEPPQRSPAILVTSLLIPSDRLEQMHAVSQGITGYRQLVILKAPIKLSLIIMLLIITLLILFGAIWFGFYIARSLTGPINKLALATRRVADGDLNFILDKESDDEMGLLVDSFNSMTADINASNKKLALAHQALQQSNLVSEQQRRYLETILESVAAGVIALDENNKITTINRFAEELLHIKPSKLVGKDFHHFLPKPHIMIVESFLAELLSTGKNSIERHLRVTVRQGETLSLQVNITRMVDKEHKPIGFVIVFDNLTKLEKAQRLAAWQEVARRIAHEIKNPLTPIQLSAQRLRKRYLASIQQDQDIFDQCTTTIVNQVEEIKRLVSEFSDFARMPKINKERSDLLKMVEEVFVLYKEAHKHIRFSLDTPEKLPLADFDPVQIKRVLINLLDNGVAALENSGEISISLFHRRQPDCWVGFSVADNGPGISEDVKLRLFEPYFSTRKSGTGLGLAIAHTIVSEHNGSILVRDNQPSGTVFTVELPLDS
ncbi:sensor histidine kinase [Desulfogranum mediterraneum]|uniref:sensor histidine kinase n=1 Tax=Desulfogranum mediterraneum TaxID=160661 RepID=UPI0003F9AEEB|nr:ATP-binding protein [Desulfogranum mediterraneum]